MTFGATQDSVQIPTLSLINFMTRATAGLYRTQYKLEKSASSGET